MVVVGGVVVVGSVVAVFDGVVVAVGGGVVAAVGGGVVAAVDIVVGGVHPFKR